ncbi:tryptophan-rich sensory protein [Streptomyces parvulus]
MDAAVLRRRPVRTRLRRHLPPAPGLTATIIAFGRHRRAAALLLLPYAAWVAYAAALNLDLWLDNA